MVEHDNRGRLTYAQGRNQRPRQRRPQLAPPDNIRNTKGNIPQTWNEWDEA